MNIYDNIIIQAGNKIIFNGKELPPVPSKSKNLSSCTMVDGHVYVNGYEWKDERWQKTLKALWYLVF